MIMTTATTEVKQESYLPWPNFLTLTAKVNFKMVRSRPRQIWTPVLSPLRLPANYHSVILPMNNTGSN